MTPKWMTAQLDHACKSESNRLPYRRPAPTGIELEEQAETDSQASLYERSGAMTGEGDIMTAMTDLCRNCGNIFWWHGTTSNKCPKDSKSPNTFFEPANQPERSGAMTGDESL